MQRINLYIEQGSDWGQEITLPTNLTGKTVTTTIKKSSSSASIMSFNVSILDAVRGIIKISLTNTMTSTLGGKYYHNILANNVSMISASAMTVNKNIL